MELKNKTVAVLGDSITQGTGASKQENRFVNVFSEITQSKTINYGIGGTSIAPQHTPLWGQLHDKNFMIRVPEMEENVDAVVVFGGTNDFGHGDAPFGETEDVEPVTFCGSCDVLFKELVNKYPSKPIVVMTPLHRIGEEDTINEIGLKRKILAEYVDALKKKAQKYSLPVLDLFSQSGMQPNIEQQNKLYFADGLHPNDLGHERIAKMLKKFFEVNLI